MKIQRNKIRNFFLLLKDSRFKLIASIRRYPIKVYDITSFPPFEISTYDSNLSGSIQTESSIQEFFYDFVPSCPFVTNELLKRRGLYRCACLPSLT